MEPIDQVYTNMNIKIQKYKMLVYIQFPLAFLLIIFISLSNTKDVNASGKNAMVTDTVCQQTPLKKSQEMIQFILNDLTKTYTHVGGGGISGIKQSATNTYVVSISQEERIDQITYEFKIDKDCTITVLNRSLSAVSPWEQ